MDLGHAEAVALLAFMMAGADGRIDSVEENAINEALRHKGITLTPQAMELIRAEATRSWHGNQSAWKRIRAALGGEESRLQAFAMAVEVVMADRQLEPTEMMEIQEMADQLEISRQAMSAQLAKHA